MKFASRLTHPAALFVLILCASSVAPALAAELAWKELDGLPDRAGSEGAFIAAIDGRLVVAGGIAVTEGSAGDQRDLTASAWVLDSPGGNWRPTTPLPQPSAFGTSVSSDAFAVFAGGTAGIGAGFLDSVYHVTFDGGDLVYDPLPPLPRPRARASAGILDGLLYLAGGLQGPGTPEPTTEVLRIGLDVDEPAWELTEPLPGLPRHTAGLSTQDGALFLIGGNSIAPTSDATVEATLLADTYRFTTATGWVRVADRPTPTEGGAVPFGPTHIVSVGGRGAGGDETLMYHTVTDTWVRFGTGAWSGTTSANVAWGEMVVAVGSPSEGDDSSGRVFAGVAGKTESGFSDLDYASLVAYFAVLVMMGIYFAGKGSSTDDFFLAGRRMPWWATGLSIFGTQLSSISFMAVPAKVYSTDWVYFLLQMTIVMIAVPVVFLYLPYFRRVKMTSAYEYLESRFNLPVRLYASISFVLYQLGRMAIVLFLPAIALSTVTGISVYTCILVMGALSTLYTVMGGMRAVIWTDVVQVFVLYGGALLSLVVLLTTLDGGLSGLVAEGLQYDKFHMFNWTWDWTTTAVWVVVVGNLFMNLVPYTSDQAVVQRYFTTKDEKAAARSIWTNAILIVPSTLTLFLLGTGLWAFYRANPALLDPSLPTDSIFPLFISQQLPAGVAGLLIAAVFAASMSTLDSSLNSVSAALVTDFFVRFRPESSDRSRLVLARVLTAGLGVVATATSIALATFDIGSLWDTFQGMMGLLGGGLAGLFALGIFFRSANGPGALAGAVSSVLILYWVQQHTDLHFFLYGAVGVLSCVGIGLGCSQFLRQSR